MLKKSGGRFCFSLKIYNILPCFRNLSYSASFSKKRHSWLTSCFIHYSHFTLTLLSQYPNNYYIYPNDAIDPINLICFILWQLLLHLPSFTSITLVKPFSPINQFTQITIVSPTLPPIMSLYPNKLSLPNLFLCPSFSKVYSFPNVPKFSHLPHFYYFVSLLQCAQFCQGAPILLIYISAQMFSTFPIL